MATAEARLEEAIAAIQGLTLKLEESDRKWQAAQNEVTQLKQTIGELKETQKEGFAKAKELVDTRQVGKPAPFTFLTYVGAVDVDMQKLLKESVKVSDPVGTLHLDTKNKQLIATLYYMLVFDDGRERRKETAGSWRR